MHFPFTLEVNVVKRTILGLLCIKIIFFSYIHSLLNNDPGAVLDLMSTDHGITIHNVRLYLGIVKRRTDSIIHRLNYSDQPSKILAKRDRIPKFNIDDTSAAPAEE